MANPEHVAILEQGVEVWNKWRQSNLDVEPHLSNITLSLAKLSGTNLSGTNLSGVDLTGADLTRADLSHVIHNGTKVISTYLNFANLSGADLTGADLSSTNNFATNFSHANLRYVNLRQGYLNVANLSYADLSYADLSYADLSHADLTNANFSYADFSHADLTDANLSNTTFSSTIFANVDLSTTKGLNTVIHRHPSTLGLDTIFRSKGKIPEIFLRGCGVPETLITFLPSMMEEAIQFYSCFISYSHADKEFAKRLHDRLQGVGIRCWLDEHQLNPGDKLHSTIYEAIRVYDKVILCCSETALKSWWVEKEFENVIAKEEDFHEPLLIPVALDNYLFEQSADAWFIGEIRKKRLVQKFDNWKDHDAFEAAFEKVVKALRTDGGKPPPPTPKLTPRK